MSSSAEESLYKKPISEEDRAFILGNPIAEINDILERILTENEMERYTESVKKLYQYQIIIKRLERKMQGEDIGEYNYIEEIKKFADYCVKNKKIISL